MIDSLQVSDDESRNRTGKFFKFGADIRKHSLWAENRIATAQNHLLGRCCAGHVQAQVGRTKNQAIECDRDFGCIFPRHENDFANLLTRITALSALEASLETARISPPRISGNPLMSAYDAMTYRCLL